MSSEHAFLDGLRAIATHPAARGLNDDAAVMSFGRHKVVLTHDMMVEGVHYLASANPADVAWKLVAVNLSDLAAKGAKPMGVLMGYALKGDDDWDKKFLAGLKDALQHYQLPLLGGDTVAMPAGAPRTLALTAIGETIGHIIPSRSDAQSGDAIYVTGHIGDGWAGLQLASGQARADDMALGAELRRAYERPTPHLVDGRKLSSLVNAMMDVSDGLLLDAARLGDASGKGVEIDVKKIPLSSAFVSVFGDNLDARLKAATGGDDYQLLFTARPETVLPVEAQRIGTVTTVQDIKLIFGGEEVDLPEHMGYEHRAREGVLA